MNEYQLICKRQSIREFTQEPVSVATLTTLREHCRACRRLKPEIETEIIIGAPDLSLLQGDVGYGDVLVRAPQYLLILTAPDDGDLENAGYMAADLSLRLTEMELSHCWLTITDGEGVKQAFAVHSGKRAAALLAFGHGCAVRKKFALDIKSKSEVTVVRHEGRLAPKREVSELVCKDTWGQPLFIGELDDQPDLQAAFIAASLAPSYLNLQPYRLLWRAGQVVLACMQEDKVTPEDARLGAGAVMQHFSVALTQYRGLPHTWTTAAPPEIDEPPEGGTLCAWCTA